MLGLHEPRPERGERVQHGRTSPVAADQPRVPQHRGVPADRSKGGVEPSDVLPGELLGSGVEEHQGSSSLWYERKVVASRVSAAGSPSAIGPTQTGNRPCLAQGR